MFLFKIFSKHGKIILNYIIQKCLQVSKFSFLVKTVIYLLFLLLLQDLSGLLSKEVVTRLR